MGCQPYPLISLSLCHCATFQEKKLDLNSTGILIATSSFATNSFSVNTASSEEHDAINQEQDEVDEAKELLD